MGTAHRRRPQTLQKTSLSRRSLKPRRHPRTPTPVSCSKKIFSSGTRMDSFGKLLQKHADLVAKRGSGMTKFQANKLQHQIRNVENKIAHHLAVFGWHTHPNVGYWNRGSPPYQPRPPPRWSWLTRVFRFPRRKLAVRTKRGRSSARAFPL